MRYLLQAAMFAAAIPALAVMGSASSLADDGYELTIIRPDASDGVTVYRINAETGLVSNVTGATASDIAEFAAPSRGRVPALFRPDAGQEELLALPAGEA